MTNGCPKAKPGKAALVNKMIPDQKTEAEAPAKEMIEKNPKLILKKD